MTPVLGDAVQCRSSRYQHPSEAIRLNHHGKIFMRTYRVYIMKNRSKTLYTGVTGDLARRIYEHRHRLVSGFTARYKVDQRVHAESFSEVRDAIARKADQGVGKSKKTRSRRRLQPILAGFGRGLVWTGETGISSGKVSC